MEYYLLATIALMGLGINYLFNGDVLPAFIFTISTLAYSFVRFRKFIDFKLFINALFISVIQVSLYYLVNLSNITYLVNIIAIMDSLVISLWINIINRSSNKFMVQYDKIINIYLIALAYFIIITLICPSEWINHFLYPNYLYGGVKEALIVIFGSMFAPYILIEKFIKFKMYCHNLNNSMKKA